MNVQPWQNNRIKLQVPEGHVDYINASPIVLTPSNGAEPDRYIAMQGPKQVSTDHVWRMVFEQLQDPAVIVMLTETHEGNMEKCFPYFPRSKDDPPLEINKHDEFGDRFRATVRCEGMEETPAGDAIELRKLVIRVLSRPQAQIKVTKVPETTVEDSENKEADPDVRMESPNSARPTPSKPDTTDGDGGGEDKMNQDNNDITTELEERTVYHFLYKKWPDFGVPSLSDLDSFFTLMRLSREKNAGPGNPRIVHCSAGVGRSGTFIALEHLMRELESGALANYDDVNPAASVSVPGTDTPSLGPGDGGGGSDAGGAEEAGSGPPPGGMRDMIFETVNQLREQRRTMVQAESQYLFIYRVLRQLWVAKYGGGGGDGRAEGAAVDHDNDAATAAGAGDEPAAKRLEVDPALVGKDRDRDHHDSFAE
jgi:protein tyrosine phosphatase